MSKYKGSSLPEYNVNKILESEELKDIQESMEIDDVDYNNLKKDIAENGIREPLKVYKEKGNYYLLAGHNRLKIAKELNIDKVSIEILNDLTKTEKKDFCINDNLNRRHFTREQKNNLIKYFLKKNPENSDRDTAGKTKADHKTVGKIRKELESTGEIPQLDNTIGKDGKPRTTKKKQPEKKKTIETPPPPPETKNELSPRKYIIDKLDKSKLDIDALVLLIRKYDRESNNIGGDEFVSRQKLFDSVVNDMINLFSE